MTARLTVLLEAWNLDPTHPIALFVSGASEILPETPVDGAELEAANEEVRDATSVADDLRKEVAALSETNDGLEETNRKAEERIVALEGDVARLKKRLSLSEDGNPTGKVAAEALAEVARVKEAARKALDAITHSAASAEAHLARKGAKKAPALRSLQWIQQAAQWWKRSESIDLAYAIGSTLSCDGCGETYGYAQEREAKTAKEIRGAAREARWSFGKEGDLCSSCTDDRIGLRKAAP